MVFVRLFFTLLPSVLPTALEYAGRQLGATIAFEQLHSSWNNGNPSFSISDFTVVPDGSNVPSIAIDQYGFTVNFRQSLLHLNWVFNALNIEGVTVRLAQQNDIHWTLAGINRLGGSSVGASEFDTGKLFSWVALQEQVKIQNLRLLLQPCDDAAVEEIRLGHFNVRTERNARQVRAALHIDTGRVVVEADSSREQAAFDQWVGRIAVDNLALGNISALWSKWYDGLHRATFTAHLDWRFNNGFWQVDGDLAVDDIRAGKHQLAANSELSIQGSQMDFWQLWLHQLALYIDGKPMPQTKGWYLRSDHTDGWKLTLAQDELQLDPLKRWLLATHVLPSFPTALIRDLDPGGTLRKFAIEIEPRREPFDMDLTAQLDNVSVAAWGGAPSAKNVSGQLRMGLTHGYLEITSNDLELNLPRLFRKPWLYNTATGRLAWDVVDDFYILKSSDLAITSEEADLNAKLRLDIPLDAAGEEPLDMALTVGITRANVDALYQYLPTRLPLDNGFVNWIDGAIKKVEINSGGFVYNGAVAGATSPMDSAWGLYLDVNNGTIQYDSNWPVITELNGDVLVNSYKVEVAVNRAKTLGATLTDATVAMPIGDSAPVIDVATTLAVSGSNAHKFLTQTPLNEVLDGAASAWSIKGRLNGDLTLRLPLDELDKTEVDLTTRLRNVTFAIPSINLEVNKLNGDFSYSTEQGLWANQLKGQALGHPLTAKIDSSYNKKQQLMTQINWSSYITINDIDNWLKQPWLSHMKGGANYFGQFNIGGGEPVKLTVETDLLGISTDLPAPFGKSAKKKQPYQLTLALGEHSIYLQDQLTGLSQIYLAADQNFDIEAMVINFGADKLSEKSRQRLLTDSMQQEQFFLTGELPVFNVHDWQAYFEKKIKEEKAAQAKAGPDQPLPPIDAESFLSNLAVNRLLIHDLQLLNRQWPETLLWVQPNQYRNKLPGHTIKAQGAKVGGEFWFPNDLSHPWQLDFDLLDLTTQEQVAAVVKEEKLQPVIEPELDSRTLPDMDISIKQLVFDEKPPVEVAFDLRTNDEGSQIRNGKGNISEMTFAFDSDWDISTDGQSTWLKGELDGKGFETLQKRFDLKGHLQAKRSHFDVNFEWDVAPMLANLTNLTGDVDVDLRDGRITQLDDKGATGALKIFGLLSTESLLRRLRLDFSDLYSSGVTFDKLQGTVHFDKGLITLKKPMIIEGPTSNFKLAGEIDLPNDTVDMSLVVTIPLTSNLPILSVLLGTAPHVAGIIYLADVLVGRQLDQLASVRYHISGTLSDPKMELDGLFAGQPRLPVNKSKK